MMNKRKRKRWIGRHCMLRIQWSNQVTIIRLATWSRKNVFYIMVSQEQSKIWMESTDAGSHLKVDKNPCNVTSGHLTNGFVYPLFSCISLESTSCTIFTIITFQLQPFKTNLKGHTSTSRRRIQN